MLKHALLYKLSGLEDCRIGDGTGASASEIEIIGNFTKQECIDAVRRDYPNANGATMSNPCDDDTCRCFAEINMDDWLYDRTSYQSCQFLEGIFLDTRKKVTNSFCFKSI